MRALWIFAGIVMVAAVVAVLIWLGGADGSGPGSGNGKPEPFDGPVLRLALIPERNVVQQRGRYEPLRRYLAKKLRRPVELRTVGAYASILEEFREKSIEGAFLGSLAAVLVMDRFGATVLARPELDDGTSTYHGVIITRADSPIRTIADLSGRTLAVVRTTTAGDLYPRYLLHKYGMLDQAKRPSFVPIGTHDDVATAVKKKRVDAGALKDLRLDAVLREHPEWKLRRLAEDEDLAVPNNGLIVRADVARELGPALRKVLLGMARDPEGLLTLRSIGARRFLACEQKDYAAVYDMVEALGPAWSELAIPGPPPKRPANSP